MPVYLVGRNTKVKVTPKGGQVIELGVPLFSTDKASCIYVTDVGRKVVFIEYIFDTENPPFQHGQIVALDVTGSQDGYPDIHIQEGILDIIGTETGWKAAVKAFIVVAELSQPQPQPQSGFMSLLAGLFKGGGHVGS
jgi:hypothetical protein